MNLFIKIPVVNLVVFIIYTAIVLAITKNDWEGFAQAMFLSLLISIHGVVNISLTLYTFIKQKDSKWAHFCGLLLTVILSAITFSMLS